jgi:hypothetical protein
MLLEGPSGDIALDRAAWGGITGASPYPPFPAGVTVDHIELRFLFSYNEKTQGDAKPAGDGSANDKK